VRFLIFRRFTASPLPRLNIKEEEKGMADLVFFEDGDERGRWFPYDDDTEIHIDYLSRRELKKINKKVPKAKGFMGLDETDCFNVLLGRRAVRLGWRHIKNHDHPGFIVKGEPFPFNQKNLDTLMLHSIDVSRFVNDRCIDASLFDSEDEAEPKND
jgi:hypothetical protein